MTTKSDEEIAKKSGNGNGRSNVSMEESDFMVEAAEPGVNQEREVLDKLMAAGAEMYENIDKAREENKRRKAEDKKQQRHAKRPRWEKTPW